MAENPELSTAAALDPYTAVYAVIAVDGAAAEMA